MRDLKLDVTDVRSWFSDDEATEYAVRLVRAPAEGKGEWLEKLTDGIRRCYVTDEFLQQRAIELEASEAEVLATFLPDRGSVMAGDFGEIIAFLFLATEDSQTEVLAPKKWRLKQDRLKAAPGSDVVQFVVPDWPDAGERDRVVCAEVKTKSTAGESEPIKAAIADSAKDRVSRLAKTLAWLEEKAIQEDLGTTPRSMIRRFLHPAEHPAAEREFWAVAVICGRLVDDEMAADAPRETLTDCTVLVVSIDDLKDVYEAAFAAVAAHAD